MHKKHVSKKEYGYNNRGILVCVQMCRLALAQDDIITCVCFEFGFMFEVFESSETISA